MRLSARGVVALVLLIGFYLLGFAIIAGLLAIDVFALIEGRLFVLIKLAIVTVPVGFALARGLFTVTRDSADDADGQPGGTLVSRQDQPELWRLVDSLAEKVGTRSPDEIRLVLMVNAAVTERSRMLGLLPGTRRLFIGVPLLVSLSRAQLAGVIAHELGHYGNKDTRFAGTVYRGREALRRSVAHLRADHFFDRMVGAVFIQYAKVYFRVSSSVCRRQELAADAVAARVAGAEAAASALRELPALDAGWDEFIESYATLGWNEDLLPSRFVEGFGLFLADPSRRQELDKVRANPPAERDSPYDSHPPVAQRIAAIEAIGSRVENDHRAAVELLRDSHQVFDAVVRGGLTAKAAGMTRVEWSELANAVRYKEAVAESRVFLKVVAGLSYRPTTVTTVLDLIDEGRLVDLGKPLVEIPRDAKPRVLLELARTPVRRHLRTLVKLALVDAGKARWVLSWSSAPTLQIDEPYGDDLVALIDRAVSDNGDTAGLRARLADAGVTVPANTESV